MNLLNLPSLNVIQLTETEQGDYQIQVESKSSPVACHHCGCVANLQKFGKKAQLFLDTPMHGKRVGLLMDRQRYRCKECQTTFLELLDDMDDKRLATKRLIDYIEKKTLKQTFTSIAYEVGMDEKTIRNIFRDYVNHLEEMVRIETPKWLGIDEIHILKKPRCVIANIEHNTIVDMLTNRNKETVINYLMKLPNRERIQYVAMDMWKPYKDAVNMILPQAKIVIDKFHVVRMANDAIEMVRKDLRSTLTQKEKRQLMNDRYVLRKRHKDLTERELFLLETWIENYPMLKVAYQLKEEFYELWDSENKAQAFEKYEAWKEKITPEVKEAFQPIVKAVSNWSNEIMNYFDHPITNAYTESLNSLIRVIHRMGRGYSFEALRSKVLFTEGIIKEPRQPYSRRKRIFERRDSNMCRTAEQMRQYHFNARYSEEKQSLGSSISTLIQLLEEGQL